MLRTRATSQRLVANGAAASCRRHPNGINLRRLQVSAHEITRLSLSVSAKSALHPIDAGASCIYLSGGDNSHNRMRIEFRGKISSRHLSTNPAPDLKFDEDDSEPFNPSPPVNLDIPIKNIDQSTKIQSRLKFKKDTSIPKQGKQAARVLFQSIAPHLELRTLHQLTKQLTKIISMGQHPLIDAYDLSGKKRTLKRRLDQLFDLDKGSNATGYSWSVKSHLWLKPILYQFFMGKFIDNPYSFHNNIGNPKSTASTLKSLSYQNDSTYPPNINRAKFQKNLKTLIKAREMSLKYPMFWTEKAMSDSGYFVTTGKHKDKKKSFATKENMKRIEQIHAEKTPSQLRQEAELVLEILMHKLPQPHFEKVISNFEKFGEVDGNLAVQKRESWYIDEDSADQLPPGPSKIQSLNEIAPKDVKQNKITVLGTNLHKLSKSHAHLVAPELGRYFYVDLLVKYSGSKREKSIHQASEGDKKQEIPDDTSTAVIVALRPQETMATVRKHQNLYESEKKFLALRDKFVEKMVNLQHDFASQDDVEDNSVDVDDQDVDDCSNDLSSDLLMKEFQNEQKNYKIDVRKHQEEALTETLLELRKMGLRRDGDVKKRPGRRRKGTHLRFTAVRMDQNESSELLNNEVELDQRIVFINNLPIDTTDEEIDHIYSRCGQLDSVKLFNLRPDLDPGPLTKKQLEERRRKQRINNPAAYAAFQEQSRQRPRTPVYGILKFKTAEGFCLATSPEMSLFGCVIRRHPVISIKPRDMNTLYVENIPRNLLSIELEYKLAHLLYPHQMHVMLDGWRGIENDTYQNNASAGEEDECSEPSSCEVKFEDFHAANAAYQWMKERNESGERPIASFMGSDLCEVHWFRTPMNKMKYWTRELNF